MTTNLNPLTQTLGARGAAFGMVLAAVIGAAIAVRSPARVAATSFSSPSTVLPARILPADLTNVAAEVGGTIQTVLVTPGAKVTAGQVIAVIESAEARNNYIRAEARWQFLQQRSTAPPAAGGAEANRRILNEQLATGSRSLESASQRLAQFSLESATKTYQDAVRRKEEVERLYQERNLVTKSELQDAENRAEGTARDLAAARQTLSRLQQEKEYAESQVKVLNLQLQGTSETVPAQTGAAPAETSLAALELREAGAALAAARKQLDGQTIRARSAGTVLTVKVRPGDFAWIGAPVATISDLSKLALESALSAEMAASIKVGMPVRVRFPNGSIPVQEAKVTSVTLVPDQAQQAYMLHVVTPNPSPDVILAGLEGAIELRHTGQTN